MCCLHMGINCKIMFIHMLGAIGLALRGIEIMQLCDLGWMWGEKIGFYLRFC